MACFSVTVPPQSGYLMSFCIPRLCPSQSIMPANQPLPDKFNEDPRVHFDTVAGKFQYEDEDTGKEYEWNGQVWVELVR